MYENLNTWIKKAQTQKKRLDNTIVSKLLSKEEARAKANKRARQNDFV